MYFSALFSELSILHIWYILYIFPMRKFYIAAYMKQEDCVRLLVLIIFYEMK